MNWCFEQGPIRPPSEASSLLVRLTRNCPWNKCIFCHTYKGTKFELRGVEEIKADIQVMKDYADKVIELSWKMGEGGDVNRNVLKEIYKQEAHNGYYQSVAVWLYFGGENVFLQDANSLIMKTADLVSVLTFLKGKFPKIKRITSYCRSHTAARKTVQDFKQLREAGLSRIHVGMESGSDEVLTMVCKGVTSEEHIKAGTNIRQAGIELSEYFMPGLGGVKLSVQNALETAKVMNLINPDFIRLRTLHVVPATELEELVRKGEFQELTDDGIISEIKLFITKLDVYKTKLVSDHILNLLEELEGELPGDKPKMLASINKYLSLPEKDKLIFRLGRRSGNLRRIDDLNDKEKYFHLKSIVDSYEAKGRDINDDMLKIMSNYI